MTSLRIGVTLPQWNEVAGPTAWTEIAQAAESMGFDFVSKGDHIVFVDDEQGWGVDTPTYDQFLALAFAAGATDDLGVLTNINVVPYRHPILLTKLALTLDALSDGNFTLGVGVGWYEAEFDALDVPIGGRGRRADEFLEILTRAYEDPVVSLDGPYHQFEDVGFYPRPTHPDGPPVLVGGSASASFRRAAQYGDGWILPSDPDGIRDGRQRLETAWDDFDRESDPVIGAEAHLRIDSSTNADRTLAGSTDEVIDGVQAYLDAGTTLMVLSIIDPTDAHDVIEQLEHFAQDVRPSFE